MYNTSTKTRQRRTTGGEELGLRESKRGADGVGALCGKTARERILEKNQVRISGRKSMNSLPVS